MEGLKRQGDLWYSYKNKCPEGGDTAVNLYESAENYLETI